MSKRNAMTTLTRWVLRHKKLVARPVGRARASPAFAAMKPAGDALVDGSSTSPASEAFAANSRIAAALRQRRRRRAARAGRDAAAGHDGRLARRRRRSSRPRCAKVAGRAARRARRLLRLDARPGVRLQGRPHDLRARLHPGASGGVDPGQAEARAAQAALAGVDGRRRARAGHRPRRAARRRGRRRQGRRREPGRRGAGRRRRRAARPGASSSPRGWRSCRC